MSQGAAGALVLMEFVEWWFPPLPRIVRVLEYSSIAI